MGLIFVPFSHEDNFCLAQKKYRFANKSACKGDTGTKSELGRDTKKHAPSCGVGGWLQDILWQSFKPYRRQPAVIFRASAGFDLEFLAAPTPPRKLRTLTT